MNSLVERKTKQEPPRKMDEHALQVLEELVSCAYELGLAHEFLHN